MNNIYFALFGSWFVLSLLSNANSQYALQNAQSQPLLVTFVQMLVGCIASFVVLRTRNISTEFNYKSYLPLAFVHYGVNLFNNYGYRDVSTTQVLQSLEPISTIFFTRYLLQEQPPRLAEICVIPIISGVILIASNQTHITASLLLFVFMSNLMLSYRNVTIKNMINTTQISDAVTLLFRLCSIATIIALPPLVFESNLSPSSLFAQDLWEAGILSFLYDSCAFLLLFYVSVLSLSTGSVINRVFIIIASILYFTRLQYFGILLCVIGSLHYIYITNTTTTNSNTSRNKKLVYLLVALSVFGLLAHFSLSKPIDNTNLTNPITLSTEPKVTKTSIETETETTKTSDPLSFMLIWTRAEYAFPPRLEKSIESILFHHPNALITLYASYLEGQDPLTRLRNEYPDQIDVQLINVQEMLGDTPLRKWGRFHRYWKIRSLHNFDYHLVDALRLALLWKNGGIAVDADMIFTQPIEWNSNVISVYNEEISSKILKFEKNHPFIYDCMNNFADQFDPSEKEANGKNILDVTLKSCIENCHEIQQIAIASLPQSIDTAYGLADAWEDANVESIAIDIQYWDNANKTIQSGSFVHKIITSNTFSTLSSFVNSINLNSLMKFGAYNYDTWNVGDEVQSIAAIQYLPRIDYFINRDFPIRSKHLPNITLIANGWYIHNVNWEMPANIHPIMVAFHGFPKFPYDKYASFFRQFEPIGCRDKYTERRFLEAGVDAYFSGCVTTTMQNIYDDMPRTDATYFVDAQATVLPKKVVSSMTNLTHSVNDTLQKRYMDKFEIAAKRLEKYGRAKLVMSNRIHVALPSLGMKTPVIFMVNKSESFSDPEQLYTKEPRWPGLIDLFTVFQVNTPKDVVDAYDFDNPPNNRPHDDMKKRIWAHLQRSPYIKESGRMFGVYK